MQCGGATQLVQLSKSMDSALRFNALCALRSLMFLADNACKESIFGELEASSLASLVCGNDFFFLNIYDSSRSFISIFLTMVDVLSKIKLLLTVLTCRF